MAPSLQSNLGVDNKTIDNEEAAAPDIPKDFGKSAVKHEEEICQSLGDQFLALAVESGLSRD